MPKMLGKHALAQMLVAEGVEYIFGNPGTSETPFLDGLQDFPQLQYIQALQEGTAVGMADGYARPPANRRSPTSILPAGWPTVSAGCTTLSGAAHRSF